MSKNLIIVAVVVVSLVGVIYLYQNDSVKMMENKKVIETKETSMVKEDVKPADAMMPKSKSYMPYSKEILEGAESTRRVLFFYASWCPTCIPANSDFEKNISMLPSDVTVIRVNYNDPDTDLEEKALATKYGITYQHTYVQIDEMGKVVTTWNGGSTKELLGKIK